MRTKSFLYIALFLLFAFAGWSSAAETFSAKLSGRNVVPKVTTKASGTCKMELSSDGNTMNYQLFVVNINKVTAAHLHLGKAGVNGEPVVTLFNGPEKSVIKKTELSKGSFTARELTGPLAGKTMADLMNAIKRNEIYVNVHTAANPNGEIRGEVKAVGMKTGRGAATGNTGKSGTAGKKGTEPGTSTPKTR